MKAFLNSAFIAVYETYSKLRSNIPNRNRSLQQKRKRLLIRALITLVLISSSILFPRQQPVIVQEVPRVIRDLPIKEPSFGLNSHLLTRYPDPTSMDIPAQIVADLGVQWVREDFHWHRVQPTPLTYDWTFSDASMRALLKRKIQILGVLGPSVGWATKERTDPDYDVSFYPPEPRLFAEYVRAVVHRYKRYIKHWEIWNEPDLEHFWRGGPDPVAYAELLKIAAETIRSVDPEAKILIGGFNPFDTSFLQAVAAQGVWNSFDIIAIHPYINPWAPEEGNLLAVTDGVRLVASQYGEKPIWITEVGWASGPSDRDAVGNTNQDEQANYLVRSMLILWQTGVERIFWYTLKDDPGNPYGLFEYGNGRTDFSRPKKAYTAFQTLNRQLQGTRFVASGSLFRQEVLFDFEQFGSWLRPSQPNGTFVSSSNRVKSGTRSARLDYTFANPFNDYVVFERTQPLPIAGEPYGLGLWIYGDSSGNTVRFWLRDAEGEVLQFSLGTVGGPGWHFRSAPIGGQVEPGNRVTSGGNGRLDFPVEFVALVLDDAPDSFIGSGTIYFDDLTVLQGREAYNLRLERGNAALDVLWSPPGSFVAIPTAARSANLVERDGTSRTISTNDNRFRINIGPAPMYVWHTR